MENNIEQDTDGALSSWELTYWGLFILQVGNNFVLSSVCNTVPLPRTFIGLDPTWL